MQCPDFDKSQVAGAHEQLGGRFLEQHCAPDQVRGDERELVEVKLALGVVLEIDQLSQPHKCRLHALLQREEELEAELGIGLLT